jgi:hypothetical protein
MGLSIFACTFASLAAKAPSSGQALVTGPFQSISMHDQYDRLRSRDLAVGSPTIVAVADRKGSEALQEWLRAIISRYGTNVAMEGIADVSSVPSPLRGMIREKMVKKYEHPIMLDWDGTWVARFKPVPGVPNIFLLDGEGRVALALRGPASPEKLKRLFDEKDRRASPAPQPASFNQQAAIKGSNPSGKAD